MGPPRPMPVPLRVGAAPPAPPQGGRRRFRGRPPARKGKCPGASFEVEVATAEEATRDATPPPTPREETRLSPRFETMHVQASTSTDGAGISRQAELAPFRDALLHRHWLYRSLVESIENDEPGGLDGFTLGHERFGLHRSADGSEIVYTEWAPAAQRVGLVGEFNGWDPEANVGERDEYGVWTVRVPGDALAHGDRVRAAIVTQQGEVATRIPAYVRATAPEPNGEPYLDGVFYDPPKRHEWRHPRPTRDGRTLKIYEAHIGMSGEEPRVATYREFMETVVPHAASLGYTAIQIMGVAEHALYASFGYQVTSFFAPSHRFGTPEELKELVDCIHSHGMLALMDVVHAHASSNVMDGLNQWDGSDGHYFHVDGQKGYHSEWGTRVFDYGNRETLRFLLSNLRMYVEEYGFDGFRFDGVTSMLYHHHGINWGFLGGVGEQYSDHLVNHEAIQYLKLANTLVRTLLPDSWSVTICEDVSAYAGATDAVSIGGLGFDYRLGMGIPDEMMRLAKATYVHDDGNAFLPSRVAGTLGNRRARDATVGYLESHDQAMVGGQSFLFALCDQQMYHCMGIASDDRIVYRGVGLHKTIRLCTICLGGDAYLNFMGNEFGHPEWIDFPMDGNGQSYDKARRLWSLREESAGLKYAGLEAWDAAAHELEAERRLAGRCAVTRVDDDAGLLVWEAGNGELVFVANLKDMHLYGPRVGVDRFGEFKLRLDSDAPEFAGTPEDAYGRALSAVHSDAHIPWDGKDCSLCLHDIPPWSVQVFKLDPETEKPFEPVRHFEHHQNFHVHVSEDEYIDDAEVGFY